MQFPESWLRTFCNPSLSTQELADTLTMAGLEVEELRPVAPPFTGIVVGEILEAVQHPDADRLRVCRVNVGQDEPLQIVCGAPNARAGIRVPCALVGAELPPGEDGKPFRIKVGKLRGVQSFGMLCSARELQLSEEHGGLMELPPDAPVGTSIRTYLDLDDTLFTLKLTPNLAHTLSVYGVAREVSALTGAPLAPLPSAEVSVASPDAVHVDIQATDLCGRFSGRVITGVDPHVQTPAWMVDRLARCGQRSVSPLVDISNYVMFEQGQPTHIFDRDRISGDTLRVRWAQAGETLKLLNGTTVTLDGEVGVIADDRAVESLAGIMGGDATAVSDSTRNIYVEAAFWWPRAIAGRSRRYNFATDAGHRFERGVDPSRTREVLDRITALVIDICGGKAGPASDECPHVPEARPVTLRVDRASKVIGMPVTEAQCLSALQGLGLPATAQAGVITVIPPSYRFDLQGEEDLIEEVVRIVGYDKLPHTPPVAPILPKAMPESERNPFAVRRMLAALGYQETINYSFVDARWEQELAGNDNPIRLLNPIASQMGVMRSSLIGSLLNVVKFNLDRKAQRVRIFEVGRVFLRDPDVVESDTTVAGFDQPMRVAGMAYGAENMLQWALKETPVDFFDVKGDVEALLSPVRATFEAAEHPALHPGRCARVMVEGKSIGYIGELHPRWRQAYALPLAPVVFELDWEAVVQRPLPRTAPISKYQAVDRDIAVIVKESVTHDALLAAVMATPAQGLLREATVFDVFRPSKGQPADWLQSDEKSVAIRLRLLDDQAPLTEDTIEATRQAVLSQLTKQLGARLRS